MPSHLCRPFGWSLLLAFFVGCTPSERATGSRAEPPAASTASAPVAPTEALRVLVLEPHLVPSELGLEWGRPRPWTKSGAAVVDSASDVWRIDPVKHTEELLVHLAEPDRRLFYVGAGGGRAIYEHASSGAKDSGASKMIVVDIEAGTSRELLLEANETVDSVSADGRRVLSLVPTQVLDGDPFGESKLPATLRVRELESFTVVKEWRAASGVRFTQLGLSRMAFSRDGAHVFLPGSTRDELHSVERGAVIWSAKAYGDSRAAFGAGFVAVGAPNALSIVDLATGTARKADIDCGNRMGSSDSLDRIDVEQKLLVRDCERGVLVADWSGPKPSVTRIKGTLDAAIGPDGALSMMRDDAAWLRTSRSEAVRAARPGETALLQKVGPTELRRGAGYLMGAGTCTLRERTVRCDLQVSPDGTRAYEADMGALAFLDPAAPGAARAYVHQLALPNPDEQPLRANVRAHASSIVAGDLEIPVHPPTVQSAPERTPLRVPDRHSVYRDVAFAAGGLDFYHEPGRMVAQTLWAAPSGTKNPTLRLLFGAGFALVWDAYNHVQIVGDRENAAHSLRCARDEGGRVQLLPFTACQAQVEKTLL